MVLCQHWEEVLPQRHSLCRYIVLLLVSPHSSLAEHRCVCTELRTSCASGPKPAPPLSFTAQKPVLHILPCPAQSAFLVQKRSVDLVPSKGCCENTQWILLAETSLQTSSKNWQHRRRGCTKLAFQSGKEKEAPQECAQTQCWAILRSQAPTFTFTPVRNQARRNRLMTHSAPLFSHQSNN